MWRFSPGLSLSAEQIFHSTMRNFWPETETLWAASPFFSHQRLWFSISPIFLPTVQCEFLCLFLKRNKRPVEGDTQWSNTVQAALLSSDSRSDSAAEQTGSHNKDLIHQRSNITWAHGQRALAVEKGQGTNSNHRLVDRHGKCSVTFWKLL